MDRGPARNPFFSWRTSQSDGLHEEYSEDRLATNTGYVRANAMSLPPFRGRAHALGRIAAALEAQRAECPTRAQGDGWMKLFDQVRKRIRLAEPFERGAGERRKKNPPDA
jgi:hypothetical protein